MTSYIRIVCCQNSMLYALHQAKLGPEEDSAQYPWTSLASEYENMPVQTSIGSRSWRREGLINYLRVWYSGAY